MRGFQRLWSLRYHKTCSCYKLNTIFLLIKYKKFQGTKFLWYDNLEHNFPFRCKEVQMFRFPNTTINNNPFPQSIIDWVWSMADTVYGYDPNEYRRDKCGAWIRKSSYGTLGEYGWEIDHIFPVSRGGGDAIFNLQPLHWKNNRAKSDSLEGWQCAIPLQQ